MATDQVKGMGEAMKQAQAGLKLFGEEVAAEGDLDAAKKFKEELEAKMAAIDDEVAALPGKENKKARTEKEKAKSAMKNQHDYIDACKIIKGLPPVHGHFLKNADAIKKAEEDKAAGAEDKVEATKSEKEKTDKADKAKPKKKEESAGISRAEKDELEGLKKKIIDKKAELKESGMSGGQINKNEEVVAMVTRMNELKEKETPGSTTAGKDDKKGGKKKKMLSAESIALMDQKQKEFDAYVDKLRTEFKYSKKEIAADPDYQEMKAALDKIS